MSAFSKRLSPLEELTSQALLSILTNPKNALIKQYQKLFELEDVHLEFTHQALDEIVLQAITRKTGARALRAILENTMLDIMYEIPSLKNIKSCKITESTVLNGDPPVFKSLKKTA